MGKKKTAAVAVAAAPVDFPRGGSQSQTLTSLELRDVNEKAAKDLFANDDSEETPSKKHKKRPAKEDGKDAKKRKKNADSDLNESGSSDKSKAEKSDTIAALTFKKLNPGFTLLGVIKEINDLELIVSLPNQMTGAVSITEISQEITDLVERVAANEDGDDEAEQESSLPSLNHLFKIGQSLPVLAITTEKAQDQAAKRKIELSIKPERINSTINVDEIRAGMTLSASVKSHEDNGYILSFGFKDSATHGFLHKKHAAAFIKSFDSAEKTTLAVGQVFYVSVLSMDDSKRTIGVTADPEAIAKSIVPTSHNLSFASLKPGLLIPSRVKTAVDGSGIIVSFMGLFEGNIELGHLGEKAGDGMDLAKNFKSGMKVQPRILYVDTLRKKVGFTLLNSLISWTTEKSTAQLRSVEIGTVFEDAKISRVDGELGMAMTLKNGLKGFVHATRLSDKEGAKIDGGAKHAPGTTHKTRVVGYDVCDDLLQLSMKPSVLNATFLRRSDVKAGMVVKGTVTKVEGYGVMVSLADGISGLVPKSHLAENAVLNPGKMFKLGSTVKCRVLSVNAEKRRIALTFKKPLINSQLPIITSLDPSNVGVISEGSIMSVLPFGCLVSFYNDIKALVPLRELSHSFVTDPKSIFNPGQVVQCKIISVDAPANRMIASIKGAIDAGSALSSSSALKSAKLVKLGEISQAKVLALLQDSALVEMMPSGARAILSKEHLTDHPSHVEAMFSSLQKDDVLNAVLVIQVDEVKDRVTVSAKPALLDQQKANPTNNRFKAGDVMYGYVKSCTETKCFVWLKAGVTGVAKLVNLSDGFVKSAGDVYKAGQTVAAIVVALDANDTTKVEISLKPSQIGVLKGANKISPDLAYLSSYFMEEDRLQLKKVDVSDASEWAARFAIGAMVDGVVKQRAPYGFIVSIEDGLASGLLTVEIGKSSDIQVGETIKGKVVDVDVSKKIVDLRFVSGSEKTGKQEIDAKKFKTAVDKAEALEAVVEVVKPAYTILSIPSLGNAVAFAPVRSFNTSNAGTAASSHRMGQKLKITLLRAPQKAAKAGKKFDGFASQRLIALVNPSSVTETQKKNKTSDVGRLIADAVDPTLMSLDDLTYGVVVKGKIQSIRPSQLNILLGSNLKGRVHISEVAETFKEIENVKHPLSKFKVDQILSFKVVGFHQEGKSSKFLAITHKNPTSKTVVELTLRKADLTIEANELAAPLNVRYPTIASIEEGSIHLAFVQAVTDKGITVSIGSQLNGRVTALEASNDLSIVKNLSKSFKEGMAVNVMVLSKNVEKWMLNLSIRAAASTGSALMKYPLSIATAQPGFKCVGVVTGVVPNKGLKVSIADKCYGTASLFEISDDTPADPTNAYKEGDYVACRVYKVDASSKTIHVTLRASRVNNKDTAASTKIEENAIVKGYVKSVSDSGIFVDVGYGYIGRVQIKEVSDDYVKDWKSLVEVGDVVTARTLSVDQSNKKVDLSMKKTAIDPSYTHVRKTKGGSASSSSASSMSITDLEEGMKLTGTVTSIHEYGVFIKIDDTNLKGLCHSSELSDKPISMISSLYSIGDPVLAYVLKVDLEKKRINFGLKASYFSADDAAANNDSDDEDESGDEDMEEAEEGDSMEVEEADEEEDAGDDDAENDDGFEDVEEGDEDSDEEMEEDNDEEVRATKRGPAPVKELAPLSLGGSGWGGDDDSDEELQEAAESDSGEETTNNESKKSRRAKKRAKLEEEERVAQKEQELLEVKAPDSSEAFERILMGSPNSSFLWIKFMAFHLQMAEIGKAREVGERALKSISFREPQELSNIWVALLNLENTYGDRESLMKVFERAVSFNEPKAMYLNLAGIYERSENFDELDPLFQIIVKRFKESCKVWVAYGLSLLKRGKVAESRKILERSMKSLAKRKHLKVVCKFAQMEFKHGEPERGRTLFEGIVSNHPKRLDMWSVYLDMETRAGDVAHTRRLFERAISLKLSSKKMKFLFKKYLEFEKSKGSPEGVKHVKEAAMEYVERISS